jgi:cytochrome bd-type quinol oxidase subunit 1
MTYFTLFGFMGLYALVGLLYLLLVLRIVHAGPGQGHAHELSGENAHIAPGKAQS